jgi:hypothetical protein
MMNQCPAGQRAIYRFTREEGGLQMRRYWSSACKQCPIKTQCTPSDYRRISRWEHEDVLERAQQRLDQMPDAMDGEKANCGTCLARSNTGWATPLLDQAAANVSTEMNFERAGLQPQASACNPWVRENDDGNAFGEGLSPFKP